MQISGPNGTRKREQRGSKRHYVNLVARLVHADGSELGLCQVGDISGTSALLKTSDATTLPDHFVLLLTANGAVRRRCLAVWRSEDAVGVEFFPDDQRQDGELVSDRR